MADNIQPAAKQFVKDHTNVTDTNATEDPANRAPRLASEQVADDLNRAMSGMSAAQKRDFLNDIAAEGQKPEHKSDYTNFSMSKDHHLQVTTRGFNSPINFGMSQTQDLEALAAKRANRGGHAVDGGAGPNGGI